MGWYAVRRSLHFAIMFVVLCYMYSLVVETWLEATEKQELYHEAFTLAEGVLVDPADSASRGAFTEYRRMIYENLLQERGFEGPLLLRVHQRGLRCLRFDFGETKTIDTIRGYGNEKTQSVSAVVVESLYPTLMLFGGAYLFQVFLAVRLGMRAASRPGSLLDRSVALLGVCASSIPVFAVAMSAVLLCAFVVPIVPHAPWVYRFPSSIAEFGPWLADFLSHYTMPFLVLAAVGLGATAYVVRSISVGVLQEDFIRAARARGLPERRVILGHGLRASAPPIATLIALGFFASVWGSLVVEPIFQWPGIGSLLLAAIRQRDRMLMMGLLVVITGLYQLGLFGLDLTYALLDPRIKAGGQPVTS